jgi:hypothetical protein
MIALTSMLDLLQFPEADGSIKAVCGATGADVSSRQSRHNTRAPTLGYRRQIVTQFEENHIVF